MRRATVQTNSPGANGLPRCGRPQNKGGNASRPWAVTKTNGTLRASSTSATGYTVWPPRSTSSTATSKPSIAAASSAVARCATGPDHLPADRIPRSPRAMSRPENRLRRPVFAGFPASGVPFPLLPSWRRAIASRSAGTASISRPKHRPPRWGTGIARRESHDDLNAEKALYDVLGSLLRYAYLFLKKHAKIT